MKIIENLVKYKYLLHGHFEKNISEKIIKVQKIIQKKYKKYKFESSFNYGYPHITIIYGPVIYSKNEIKINKDIINNFYPGFLSNFKKIPNDIKYIGVSPFFALDRIIIKAEFESNELNKIRNYLIKSNPMIMQFYKDFKKNKKEAEKELKKRYPNIFIRDKSYDKIPKGWIHATLFVIKSDVSEEIIKNIINYCEKYINLEIGKELALSEIGINLNNNFTKIF